jgi:uncharacterized repeat protein (TIGR01451 family)
MCLRPDGLYSDVGPMMKMGYFSQTYALVLGAALSVAATGQAQGQSAAVSKTPVNLSSQVRIERVEVDAAGKQATVLREPKDVVVVPGDRVVFMLNVVNSGAEAAAGFRATNPIPAPVTFTSVNEDWAEVSVDGGLSYGKLATMTVKAKAADSGAEISRAATAEDVTHVRWVFSDAIAPGSKTVVSYRGVVK